MNYQWPNMATFVFALSIVFAAFANAQDGTTTQETTQETQEEQTGDENGEGNGEVEEVPPEPVVFTVAEDSLQFTATGEWTKVQPRINFIDAEFAIPKVEDDPANGRLTIMGAGGSIEENVERWKGQFADQPDAVMETESVNEMTVTRVSIEGTYTETMGGPFNPNAERVERENYRMVAAIIETPNSGNYFLKLYGPKPTIDANFDAFDSLVKSVLAVDVDATDDEEEGTNGEEQE